MSDELKNELVLHLFEDGDIYDVTYNNISLYEILPSLTAVTIGDKTYKLEEYYNPGDEIILHLERPAQRVTLTTKPGYGYTPEE